MASPASAATPVTVPIVSKKSTSMIEKITRIAVSAPSEKTFVRSNAPSVEKESADGMIENVVGTVATPATRAMIVVTRIEITSAALIRRAHRTAVRIRPMRKTNWPGSVGNAGARAGPDVSPYGVAPVETMIPPLNRPMNRMNRPMPAPIARLSDSGMAFITASRKPTRTRIVTAMPSSTMTPIAPSGVSPRAVSPKATIALIPRPAARANG